MKQFLVNLLAAALVLVSSVATAQAVVQAPQKAHSVTSVSDLCGVYSWSWSNFSNYSGWGPMGGNEVTIMQDPESTNPNALLIYGFTDDYWIAATANISGKKITIKGQQSYISSTFGKLILCYAEENWMGYVDAYTNDITGIINSDGSISLDGMCALYASDYDFNWLCKNNKLTWKEPITPIEDYSVSAIVDECIENNTIDLNISAGADVASVKYNILKGSYDSSDANLNLAENDATSIYKAFNGTISTEGRANGVYTLFLMSYDASGNRKAGNAYILSIIDDDPTEWAHYCQAKYTDGIMKDLYGNAQATCDVEVEHNTTGGLHIIRVVNPYAEYFKTWKNFHNCDHNHYLYLDITDPNRVVLDHSTIGYSHAEDFEMMMCTSKAQLEREKGTSDEAIDGMNYFGTMTSTATRALDNFVITFPASSLVPYFKHDASKAYVGNKNNDFSLELVSPIPTGVETIVKDEAPVEYYNLQGVRVSEPAEGQVVIRRQGNKAEKIIF